MFKKVISCIVLCFFTFTLFTGCRGGKSDVVIFSSMESYRNLALSRQLNQAFPDLNITVQQISTGNNAAKIQAEGTSTEADIVLALETASFEKIIDNFASLDSFTPNDYLPEFQPQDNRAFTWEKYEGSIIINTIELQKRGLPEPQSYQDLLNPIYEGLIVMPNPKTSGTGYMFLNAWVNTMGKEEAFAFVGQLQKNIKQFTESGSGPIQMLNQGEAVIGLGMVFQAADQISEGSPLKVIVPTEGCPYNTTQFGIIKGRENDEKVRQVFQYLNHEFFDYDKKYFAPGQVIEDQVVLLEHYPEQIISADVSTITDTKLKDELLAQWQY